MRPRALTAIVLALLGLIVVAGPVQAQTLTLDAVAESLRTDPVYNDPSAENALTTSQADDLRAQIEGTGEPIFVAVLPAAAGASPDTVLAELQSAVGLSGTYAVVVGDGFRAGSTQGSVRAIADAAFQANAGAGPYAVLTAFVDGVAAPPTAPGSSGSSGGSGWVLLLILAVIGAGIAVLVVLGRRSARRAQAARLAALKTTLDEDVTALGERLGSFDHADPRLDDAGRTDLTRALDSYTRASERSSLLRSDADVVATTQELEEGRYALACVEARMAGEPLPLRRPPCLMDPRHGPSSEDVPWSADGGPAHPVPVCAACAATMRAGGQPEAREVEAGGARVPYWRAGPQYAPYAQGYFGGVGSVLPALFVGTMLASAFTMPMGVASAGMVPGGEAQGGGDFGGGDFGGGGFGGGEFGGGDFGGGGFGGGDF